MFWYALTEIKIAIQDAFGHLYYKKVDVKIVEIKTALKYNPRFGLTEKLYDKDVEDVDPNKLKEDTGGSRNEITEGDDT